MNELNFAADALNAAAPPGERLAYVNPNEEGLLKAVGGSGQESSGGVPSGRQPAQGQQRSSMAAAIPPSEPRQQVTFASGTPFPSSLLGDDGGAAWREQMAPMLEGDPGAPEGAQGGRGGLLELYEQHLAPSIIRQQRQAAAGEIDMLREMGPQFMEAQRAADPGSERLRSGLQQKAQAGLDAGQGLTEEELAGITESVRSGQSARGVSFQRSQPGMISETLARLGAGRQAEAQRMQRAQSVLQQTSTVDPFLALTGRSARMPGQVAGQLGTSGFALQAGPQLFNPESQYAGALAGGNQANIMNARMATQANQAAMMGGLLGGIGQLGGGYFTGKGMQSLQGS